MQSVPKRFKLASQHDTTYSGRALVALMPSGKVMLPNLLVTTAL